jgi:hypothetical protein
MLGPAKPRRLDQPIAVSLEDLVPPDHFYRHLEAKLNLGFVRDWARELYAERGRPSIDPVVFFKLQVVMFCEGIRSERQLITTVSSPSYSTAFRPIPTPSRRRPPLSTSTAAACLATSAVWRWGRMSTPVTNSSDDVSPAR